MVYRKATRYSCHKMVIGDTFVAKISDTFQNLTQISIPLLFMIIMDCMYRARISIIDLSYLAYTVVKCYISMKARFFMVL